MLSNSEVNMRKMQLKLFSSTQLEKEQMPMYLEDLTVENCKNLELSASQLIVSYKSNGTHKPVSIRSNKPIPKRLDFYYFEMTVSKSGRNRKLVIGLSEQEFGLANNLPGFDEWSVGYHGHTGSKHAICRDGAQYGPVFRSKDIIGCGLNFTAKTIFFTKNGVYLGDAFERAQTEVALFPTVGMASNKSEIMLNFGQNKFCFDIDQYIQKLKSQNALSATIPAIHPPLCRMPTPNLIGHKRPAGNSPTPEKRRSSPPQQHSLASASADLMASQTSSSNSSELVVFIERFDEAVLPNHSNSIDHVPDDVPITSQDTVRRSQQIKLEPDWMLDAKEAARRYILDGRIQKAIAHIDNHYPGLLVNDKYFYFSLLLQKFVENIRDTYQLAEGNAIARPESPEKLWLLSGKLCRDFAKINDNSKSCQELWLRVSHVNKMMVYLETNQENGDLSAIPNAYLLRQDRKENLAGLAGHLIEAKLLKDQL